MALFFQTSLNNRFLNETAATLVYTHEKKKSTFYKNKQKPSQINKQTVKVVVRHKPFINTPMGVSEGAIWVLAAVFKQGGDNPSKSPHFDGEEKKKGSKLITFEPRVLMGGRVATQQQMLL